MEQLEIEANGLIFRGQASGPDDGPLALLAHGFPDSPATWRHLHGPLAAAGYRVVSPAMRGYAPSDVPADRSYELAALATDLIELTRALGADERAVLIGHDWGAVAAYAAAAIAPRTWRAMVTMAVPPPAAMGRAFHSIAQLKRSWYIFYFQTPGAEEVVGHASQELLATLWRDWSPGYDASEDLAELRRALNSPERVAAAVGYYRAMDDPDRHDPALASIRSRLGAPPQVPILYLHGEDDGCLGADVIGNVAACLPSGSRSLLVSGAGHFLQLERPQQVAEAVIDFLGSAAP